MEDIELVIKIPEKVYKHILSMQFYIPGLRSGKSLLEEILKAIRTGTPLPKGHGVLKDSDLLDTRLNFVLNHTGGYKNTPIGTGITIAMAENLDAKPIIEADKAESEE